MGKILLFILSTALLSFNSCKTEDFKSGEISYYGNKFIVGISLFQNVDLSQLESFYDLYNRVEEKSCNDEYPVVNISIDNRKKCLVLYNPCPMNYACLRFNKKNILRIVDEEIIIDKTFELNDLDSIMQDHYFNPDRNQYHSEKPEKAIVSIKYQRKNTQGFLRLLDQLTNSFEKLDLDVNLTIILDHETVLTKTI